MLYFYKKKRWLPFVLFGVTSTLLVPIVATAFSIYSYGNTNFVIKGDAAIVLGAAVWGDKPSPVFRERINHAINLYKTAMVRKIIFTGGVGENDELAEAIVGKRYAQARGVKPGDILIETESRTTHQNLLNAREVAFKYSSLTKFLIVSDPLHLKRAVLMAQDLGMEAYPSPTPTTRYRSFKSQFQFLIRETYFYFVYQIKGI
jgi:uncharacterized SAM-binding protein YcdF (DUF218 family)